MSIHSGIDPRGPRVAAGITSLLLAIVTALGLIAGPPSAAVDASHPLFGSESAPGAPGSLLTERALQPAFLLTLAIAALFLWGILWPRTQPWAVLFRALIRPRLSSPKEQEDPRPPRFAQGVGLIVVSIGLLLHLLGVPWALPVSTAAAFVAAFLNAVFGLCLGCQLYLLLQRAGVTGRGGSSVAT